MDMARPYPPVANDTGIEWFRSAFDALPTPDVYEAVDLVMRSCMHAVGINRLCEGTISSISMIEDWKRVETRKEKRTNMFVGERKV